MKYRIRLSVIFMVSFLLLSLSARAFDLYSEHGDFKLEVPTGKQVVTVYSKADIQSDKVGFLPRGAFILKASSDETSGNMRQISYAYIAAKPECAEIEKDITTNGNVRMAFESSLFTRSLRSDTMTKVKAVLEKFPSYCYRQDTAWIESRYLKSLEPRVKTAPKLEAALGGDECMGCKAETKKSNIDENIKNKNTVLAGVEKMTAKEDVIQTPPPKDSSCGQPDKPLKKNLGLITVGKEWTPYVKTFLEERVNKKGQKYKVKREKIEWSCEFVLPEGCGKTGPDIYPLDKTVAIADAYARSSECTKVLDLYYESCSGWKNDDFDTRFKKVKELSKNAVASIKEELGGKLFKTNAAWNTFSEYKFSKEVSPELLTCIAKRESTKFEPNVVNYTACESRVPGNKITKYRQKCPLPKNFMNGWRSEAHGLSQHLWPTVHDYWTKWLKNDHPVGKNGKTFEEVYQTPENFFKALSADPQLQIELMARHLDYVFKLHSKLKAANPYQKALLSYDTDQKDTYLPAVNACVTCLKKDFNDISCMGKLHPQRSRKR